MAEKDKDKDKDKDEKKRDGGTATFDREVADEIQRERLEKFWKDNSKYILGGAAAIAALALGYNMNEQKARSAAEAGGARYEQAMSLARSGKEDEAAKAFQDLAKGSNAGYAALAELKLAGSHLKSGRPKDALEAFEKLAVRPGTDSMIQGFAQLQAAGLRLGEADFTEMQNRLTPLTVPNSPWRQSASEMLGTAAFKAGKLSEARALLSPLLGDPMLPRSAAERVALVMTAIAAAEKPVAAVPSPAAPDAPKDEAKKDEPKDAKPNDTKKDGAAAAEPSNGAPVKTGEASSAAPKPEAPKEAPKK